MTSMLDQAIVDAQALRGVIIRYINHLENVADIIWKYGSPDDVDHNQVKRLADAFTKVLQSDYPGVKVNVYKLPYINNKEEVKNNHTWGSPYYTGGQFFIDYTFSIIYKHTHR